MKRRLLNLLTALSLLLCVAAVVLWKRSYSRTDMFEVARLLRVNDPEADVPDVDRYARFRLRSRWGQAFVEWKRDAWYYHGAPARWSQVVSSDSFPLEPADDSVWSRLGFERFSARSGIVNVALPLWLPVVATAALPAVRAAAYFVRRRRTTAGTCPACGYDLTGNVSGVCPECGASAQ